MEPRTFHTIRVELTESIATITLNKPERKNPLGTDMVNELCYALDDCREADDVRVIVLTGAGHAFSAGGDLQQMLGGGADDALPHRGDYAELLLRFPSLGKPTIARIPGVAMGGALGLIASCDFAIACESAKLGTPEIKRGFFPMMIMAVLRRVVSRRRLMEMILLGESISAREAERIELISKAVPEDRLDLEVSALATKLSAQSPSAMRMGLAAFHAQADQDLETALPFLRQELVKILGTDDAREGVMAFLEKRAPRWTGR